MDTKAAERRSRTRHMVNMMRLTQRFGEYHAGGILPTCTSCSTEFNEDSCVAPTSQ